MIVDEMHMEHPELLKDQFWDEVVPKELLYTVGSEHYRRFEPKGSAEEYKVKDSEAIYANLNALKGKQRNDSCYADYVSDGCSPEVSVLIETSQFNLNDLSGIY